MKGCLGIGSIMKMSKEDRKAYQEEQRIVVGNRLRKLREEREMSQREVADALGLETQGAYGKLEGGNVALQPHHCVILADLFNVSCDYILRGVEAENVEVCKRLGLTQSTVYTLEQREQIRAEWEEKENHYKSEFSRIKERAKHENDFRTPNSPLFEQWEDVQELEIEAGYESEKCEFCGYLMNALLCNSGFWETMVRSSMQASNAIKEIYTRVEHGKNKAFCPGEIEERENAINAAKYIANLEFAKFFDAMCKDTQLITCKNTHLLTDEDISGKFEKWLNRR